MYYVQRISHKNQIEKCNRFYVDNYMWDSKFEPRTYGWMGYIEDEGLFVKMVCEEKNPKAIYKNHKDPVYQDSAMEIFLAFLEEGEVLTNDCMYTNFEINSNGAMLANYGVGRNNRKFLSDEQYEQTGVTAIVDAEKWYIEVLFPESYLREISDFEKIKEGKSFYCNFYKISQSSEILHFGSFSPIKTDKPNFHIPIYFEEVRIER